MTTDKLAKAHAAAQAVRSGVCSQAPVVRNDVARLVGHLDAYTERHPQGWAITRSFCAPREGYCIWLGEKSIFRPTLTAAVAAMREHLEGLEA